MDTLHKRGFIFSATLIALALVLACSGCVTSRPYTKGERIAFAGAVAGQAWDVGSTAYAITQTDTLEEGNPIFAGMDDGELLASMFATKAALIGAAWLFCEWKPDARITVYSLIGGGGAAAGAWNTYNITNER